MITINDCTTTLLFPFVTNQAGFNTGLAITNASDGSGSCTIEYSGPAAPADLMSQPIEGGEQWVDQLSKIAPEFQGYVTASCEFRDAHGFAFITDGLWRRSAPSGAWLSRGVHEWLQKVGRPIA